jgi:hypothetical protein
VAAAAATRQAQASALILLTISGDGGARFAESRACRIFTAN